MAQLKGAQGSRLKAQGKSSSLQPSTLSLQPNAGFTFVELLIAATMISILFVGLGTHLRGGLTVWQRTTATTDALQRQRVAFDRLERDLSNAIVYDDRAVSYGNVKGQLPKPQFDAAAIDVYTVSTQPFPSVRFVTYACERVNGTPGLWRTSQSVGEARARLPQPTPELVLPDCESMSFRYAYVPPKGAARAGLEWKAQWPDSPDDALKLPRLIEVTVQVSGRSVRRVCAIPIGLLGASE